MYSMCCTPIPTRPSAMRSSSFYALSWRSDGRARYRDSVSPHVEHHQNIEVNKLARRPCVVLGFTLQSYLPVCQRSATYTRGAGTSKGFTSLKSLLSSAIES